MDKNQEKDFLLLRNLKDAGCNAEQIEKFFQLRQGGKRAGSCASCRNSGISCEKIFTKVSKRSTVWMICFIP